MEKLKKKALQVLTTGTTTGGDIVITPDLDAVYVFKIGITAVAKDIGFFDAGVGYGYYGDQSIGIGEDLL